MLKIFARRTLLSLALFAFSAPAFASTIGIAIVGAKQGAFKPSSQGTAFSFSGSSPFDASTGQGTGKIRYTPIVITKPIDASSMQILQAMATSENLPTVNITVFKLIGNAPQAAYTMRLKNARVTQINQYGKGAAAGNASTPDSEDVSLVFQTAEFTVPGSTSVSITNGGAL